MKWRAALALTLMLACAKPSVERADWQRMTSQEKTLYVHSLLGAEIAKERKGGNDRRFPREAGAYVQEIDAAYAGGDARPPHVIFESKAREPSR